MFERYTEAARKSVFFARYAASQFGSPYIETEHLLLGILRADGPLALRLLKGPKEIESLRAQIDKQSPLREKTSISVDLPLSQDSRCVLTRGAKEADRLEHKHIAPEHLLLGLLLEEKCCASKIMLENGLTHSQVEQEAIRLPAAGAPVTGPTQVSRLSASAEGPRDLTAEARNGALSPLIGRERELERIIQIRRAGLRTTRS